MPDPLGGLSYRARLSLAMIGAALLPLLVLAVALSTLSTALRDEGDRRLGAAARSVALAVGSAPLDAETAIRLAQESGLAVGLYDADGVLRGASDVRLVASSMTGPLPGEAPVFGHRDGVSSAFVAIGTDQPPRGFLAVAAPGATLPGGLDAGSLVIVALTLAILLALIAGWLLARLTVRPLGRLSRAVARLGSGDLDERLPVEGGDELAAVAISHNRLADALAARNRSLALVLRAIAELAPSQGVELILATAPAAAAEAFGFTHVSIDLTGPAAAAPSTMVEDHVPGEAPTFPTLLRAGGEAVGTLWTSIPPTREWGPADQDLLELFAIELAAAIRNAQLFAEVERLSETKSEFLRGVSHNLQTPLTSIRAIAADLAEASQTGRAASPSADRGLGIIVEQSERLSRLVEQLLTVSRLEAGTLRAEVEVFAPAPLIDRAWESLARDQEAFAGNGVAEKGLAEKAFELRDQAPGWLAAADVDRVDQVVWALLDNALKYGQPPVEVVVRTANGADPVTAGEWLVVTIRDHGPGIAEADHAHVFDRFSRLGLSDSGGTGLGLSVARGLVEAMGGRLWIAATRGRGATFAFSLPAERIEEE
jgi:two-component system sensor histidine kinase VicK